MGVFQSFVCLVIDISDFFLHVARAKQCKNTNSIHMVPTFWEESIRWKMQHLHAYNDKCYNLDKWRH